MYNYTSSLCCKYVVRDVTVRVAEVLGAEKALQLLYCTEDLEEAGGLMTLVHNDLLLLYTVIY